jgi:hypothetical protein
LRYGHPAGGFLRACPPTAPTVDDAETVSFATARELNEISRSDVADVSCKLIVTV